eukprot:SAG31_NODE_208_length_20313_cov_6.143119_15_plen_43_part_00
METTSCNELEFEEVPQPLVPATQAYTNPTYMKCKQFHCVFSL